MRFIVSVLALLAVPLSGWADDARVNLKVSGAPDPTWHTVGHLQNITNSSDVVGYGMRSTYYTMARNPGFDLASANILISRGGGINHTAFMSQWLVAVCPQEASAWGCIASEMNPVNRGTDQGWHPTRTTESQLTGGVQVVPETNTFGEPGIGSSVLFG